MYYRRKILLALLQKLGGSINAIEFQKLLFLFNRELDEPRFYFVPYKYGCFSFQSYADKRVLIRTGILEDNEKKWKIKDRSQDYIGMCNDNDKIALEKTHSQFRNLRNNDLIRYLYLKYPYFAINSLILADCLTITEQKKIDKVRPADKEICLFTIGYEGVTFDEYLNKLIKNNVRVLCDVRKNALSMKYGFSKNQLKNAAEKLDIKYIHIPELGIESNKRQALETQKDYDKLFKEYERTTLNKAKPQLTYLYKLIQKEKRVALTCFERESAKCHRTRVAFALQKLPQWKYSLIEL